MQDPYKTNAFRLPAKIIQQHHSTIPRMSSIFMQSLPNTSKNARIMISTMSKNFCQRSYSHQYYSSIRNKERDVVGGEVEDLLKNKEKGKHLLRKTFNKSKTDLEHNFIGKRYLHKIQEQKNSIKDHLKSSIFVRDCKMCEPSLQNQNRLFLRINTHQKHKLNKLKAEKLKKKFRIAKGKNINEQDRDYGRFKTQISSPKQIFKQKNIEQRSLAEWIFKKEMSTNKDQDITPWEDLQQKWLHKI